MESSQETTIQTLQQALGPFVVEVEAYEGEGSAISLEGTGCMPIKRMYCVGVFNKQGRVELIDNGYNTLSELFDAWPELDR